MRDMQILLKFLLSAALCVGFSFFTFIAVLIYVSAYVSSTKFVNVCNEASQPAVFILSLGTGSELLEGSASRPLKVNECDWRSFKAGDADYFRIEYLGKSERFEYISGVTFLTQYEITLNDNGVSSTRDETYDDHVTHILWRTWEIFFRVFLPFPNGEPYWRDYAADDLIMIGI